MKQEGNQVLERLVLSSCADLFLSYRISLKQCAPTSVPNAGSAEVSSGGMIGFAGEGVSGTLLVVGSFEFLANCRPVALRAKPLTMSSATDWILVRDWSMELANQLLGRIRNRLYESGVTIDVRSPIAVSGHPLAVSIRSRKTQPLQFATRGNDLLRVWFEAVVGPAFESAVAQKPDPPRTLPREGEVIMF